MPTRFDVPEDCVGQRLDIAINRIVDVVTSRSFAAKLIDAGLVRVGGRDERASYRLAPGDALVIDLGFLSARTEAPQAESIPLDILFEDDDLLVINKAAGMVVHPGAGVSSGTLVNAVLGHCGVTLPSLGEPARAGIVHRLDRDTSGVMVVAKSQCALTGLSEQFARHAQKRLYTALVYGVPSPSTQRIETRHGRDARNRLKFAVVGEDEGKPARMDIAVEETFCGGLASAVRCALHTGRTHQIRVQMTHLKHPLLGDALYGAPSPKLKAHTALWAQLSRLLTRQMLHARLLGFTHPGTGAPLTFMAPPPADFSDTVDLLRKTTRF